MLATLQGATLNFQRTCFVHLLLLKSCSSGNLSIRTLCPQQVRKASAIA